MKKLLLTLLGGIVSISLHAQEPLKAGTYYIQNVASGDYISVGANWGTRCILAKHGLDITVTGSNGTYTLVTGIQGSGKALRPSDGYMDQSGTWTIEPSVNGTYTMFNGTNYFGYSPTNAHPWVPRLDATSSTDDNTRWRFLTKEDLTATLSSATKENPIDASFLIQAPDFLTGDYRITGRQVWGPDVTETGGNITGDSYLRNNMVAEKFNTAKYNITQTLTDIPNGVYSLSVQGFYRNGSNTNAAAAHNNGSEQLLPYLYANNRMQKLSSIYSQAKTTETGGWNYSTAAGYVPNFQDAAAACFDSGENVYLTTIKNIVVLDGRLTIGIEKQSKAVENDWACFDNFTLMYYGFDNDLMKAEALKKITEYESKNTTSDEDFASALSACRTAIENAGSIEDIETALDDAKKAYMFYATKPEPTDKPLVVSDQIMLNTNLSEGTSGWTTTLVNNEGYNLKWSTYSGDGMNLLETYSGFSAMEMTSFSIKQTVSLSPGMYRLKGYAFFRYGLTYNTDLTTEGEEISTVFLTAGENQKAVMRLGDIEETNYANDMAAAATTFKNGNYENSLIFEVTEPTTLDVGYVGEYSHIQSWFIMGPIVLEKINDQILEAEELANFDVVKRTYSRLWKEYTTITDQATDHAAFDEYLAGTNLALADIVNRKQLEEKDAEVWSELCNFLKTHTAISGQFDITSLITNPSFSRGKDGWTIKSGLGWGDSGTVEVFNTASGNIHQLLKNMPAGSYTLKVQAFYRPKSFIKAMNDYHDGTSEVTARLYLNGIEQTIKDINDEGRVLPSRPESDTYGAFDRSIPNTLNGATYAFDSGLYWNILRTDLTSDSDIELGLKYDNGSSSNWMAFDNFRLYYGAKTTDLTLSRTERFTLTEDTYANVTTDIELVAGQLNPLCVPFDLDINQFESAWTVMGFNYDADAKTLVGILAPIHEIKAGTPCFVKVNENMTLKGSDVLVHAAVPDSIPVAWENGALIGYYGKSTLLRAFRMDDGETMVYSLSRINQPGYKVMAQLPSEIYSKVKTITFEEVDFNDMDITINLENLKARSFINTAKYFTSASSSIVANYNAGPPSRRDEPHTALIPMPVANIPSYLEYSLSEDFSDATTINIPAKSDFVEVANLIPQNTYYFRILTGKTEVAKGKIHTEGNLRMIKAPSVSNIRDLGGWLTLDGNRVNYGKIYRGGEMNAGHVMTDGDREVLRGLGIGAEVDLRQDVDFGGNIISTSALGNDVPYIYLNQSMFGDDALQQDVDKYKAIFPFILNNLRENKSVYFHCIWGADRTGATAFLLEGLIGMTMDQMYKDYELTTFSVAGLREKTGLDSKFTYINTLEGKTLQEKFFNYWNGVVGIPAADLCEFIEIMTNGTSSLVTGISDVRSDIDGPSAIESYYSIDGRRQEGLMPGINIIRMTDGTVRKVVVR